MKRLLTSSIFLIFIFAVFHPVYAAGVPNRIISLAPNITEILFALGLGGRIVGVTSFCDYPAEAKSLPKIGGMSNPSLEAVIRLKPDIVIMTTDGNPKEFAGRLHSLKIKTYVFEAQRLSELPQAIRDLGKALGAKGKADILAGEIEASVKKIKMGYQLRTEQTSTNRKSKIENQKSKRKKILFIIWPEPLIVAGPGTVIHDAINLLGGENAAAKTKIQYPKYSIEEIIHQSPDFIFIGKGHEHMEKISKGLLRKIAVVPAMKKGSVFYLSDNLYRLGPRIVKGIEEMASCLN